MARKLVRIAAQLEPELIELIDRERKGRCSRASIVRMALMDRYHAREPRQADAQTVA